MRKSKKGNPKTKGGKNKVASNDDLLVVGKNNVWHFDNDYPYTEAFTWITKSDAVYGTGGKPFRQGQDPFEVFQEEAPNSPWTQPEFYSYQWEYEFSKDTIIFTEGGDDGPVDEEPGRDMNRLVIKGNFKYTKDGISGTIDYWGRQSTPTNQINTKTGERLLSFQPLFIYRPSNSLPFSGFGQIDEVISAASDSTTSAQIGDYSDQPVPINPGEGEYGQLAMYFPTSWWENPFVPNLI